MVLVNINKIINLMIQFNDSQKLLNKIIRNV